MSGPFDRAQAAQLAAAESTKMLAYFRTIDAFTIGTTTYGADYLVPLLTIDPAQLDVQMSQVSGWIGYWGVLTAKAKKEHDAFEARYRVQRDTFIIAASEPAPVLDEDAPTAGKRSKAVKGKSKTAAEAEWRTKPEYTPFYDKIADLEYAWSAAQMVYEALLRKANMLTALGKVYANESAVPQPAGIPSASR